jgi:hypothetical protein
MKFLAPALVALSLIACSEPAFLAVDGSTQATYKESLKSIRESLSVTQRLKFEAAMKTIQAQEFAKADDRTAYDANMRARLAGKSADAIIAEAAAMAKSLEDKAVDAAFEAKKAVTENAGKTADVAKDVAGEAAKQAAKDAIAN